MKIKIVLFLLVITLFKVNGQNTTSNKKFYEIDIKSPGIENFVKYGNLSSPTYTGNLSYEIPLISNIKGGTPISISLGYDASGFRPLKRPGLVGLNWFLNMGGAITRDVNGVADDQIGAPETNGALENKITNGFIVGVRNRTHDKNNVYNILSSIGMEYLNLDFYLYGNNSSQAYEGDPDIFNFNFNGISGKFFMGNDGQLKVINNTPGNLKVDISNMQNQPYYGASSKPIYSLIKITDDSGNKYYFGGESKHLEYTTNDSSPIISTWHLYRIEYYTGKVTNFIFRDDSQLSTTFESSPDNVALHAGFPLYSGSQPSLRDFCVYSEAVNDSRYLSSLSGFSNIGDGGIALSPVIQKIAILEKIVDDNYIINFSYSRQQHIFNTRNSLTDMYIETSFARQFLDIKLDEIRINKNNNGIDGDLINKFTFNYVYLGGTIHSRMFLNSITEYGKKPYVFEYHDTTNLPKPITFGIDHWGFWNGRSDNNNQLIPYQNYQSNGDYTDCSNSGNESCISRNPNFNYAIKGVLKKVTYPTSGYTEFEYEPHDYSKRLESKSSNNYIPILYDVAGIAGGVRLKKITDYDGNQTTNIKMYEYKTDANLSSGILLKWPRYTLHWTIPPGNLNGTQFFGYLRSNPFAFSVQDSPIVTYTQVTEKTISNGKKILNFSNYITTPDVFYDSFRDHAFGINVTPKNLARHYNTFSLDDMSIERGRLVQERVYDQNNVLKYKTDYVYNIDPLRFQKWSTRLHLSGPSSQSNKIYYYSNFLTKKVTTEYNQSASLVEEESMDYTATPLYNNSVSEQDVLYKKGIQTSYTNEKLETEYRYPWNEYSLTSTDYNNFKNENLTIPLREIQYRNGIKISEQFTKFEMNTNTSNYLLPKEVYMAKFPNNFSLISGIGNLERKFVFNKYDSKGNVLEYNNENGISVSIIWGYNKTLPIAKIENATYTQVQQYETNLQTLSNGTDEQALLVALANLRIALPNAMVTTYTHKPLIGISTVTDPKGDNQSYHYDSFNRLQFVKDKEGNILSENEYHYKN